MALTFDAGPSVRTPQILAILAKYHVHATFFTLGKNHVMVHPQMVKDMVAQGHEVETLTWSHQILTKISKSEVRKEITEGRDAVQKVTGVRPTLLRPPQGRTSPTVTRIARQLGMAEVVWSANGADYRTTDSEADSPADPQGHQARRDHPAARPGGPHQQGLQRHGGRGRADHQHAPGPRLHLRDRLPTARPRKAAARQGLQVTPAHG